MDMNLPVSRTKAEAPRASVRTQSRRLSEARRKDMRGNGRSVGNRGHISGCTGAVGVLGIGVLVIRGWLGWLVWLGWLYVCGAATQALKRILAAGGLVGRTLAGRDFIGGGVMKY